MEGTLKKIDYDQDLDLTGLLCPVPIVLTSEKIKGMKEGQVLRVKATDPGYERDLWNWIRQTGNELLDIEKDGTTVIAYIRKTRESNEPSLWYWIKFHSLGVKLHAKLFFTKLLPAARKPDHFITFLAISEGVRAEKMIKEMNINIRATLLPVPDEIDPRCGVVLAVKGHTSALKLYNILRSQNVGVEKIYRKDGKLYREVDHENKDRSNNP